MYVWHDSPIYATWVIHNQAVDKSCEHLQARLIHMCNTIHARVCDDCTREPSVCVTRPIHMCDVKCWYVGCRQMLRTPVDASHPHVHNDCRHESFIRSIWLIYTRYVRYSYVGRRKMLRTPVDMTHLCVCNDSRHESSIRVVWTIHILRSSICWK